jgi:hypothetical protein
MKVNFRVTGTMEIPDDVVMHEDILNQLYALEFNNKMYMLQVCLVAESPDGEYEMIHQYDEMEQHDIKNVRYDAAEFEPIIED